MTKNKPQTGHQSERALRELVGAGSSQLGTGWALRGRDVNRPTPQDLHDAERDVVIAHRNWQPPAGADETGPRPARRRGQP